MLIGAKDIIINVNIVEIHSIYLKLSTSLLEESKKATATLKIIDYEHIQIPID